VERVKRHLERQKQTDVVEVRISATVVKRRARPSDAERPKARDSQTGVIPAPAPSSPEPVAVVKPKAARRVARPRAEQPDAVAPEAAAPTAAPAPAPSEVAAPPPPEPSSPTAAAPPPVEAAPPSVDTAPVAAPEPPPPSAPPVEAPAPVEAAPPAPAEEPAPPPSAPPEVIADDSSAPATASEPPRRPSAPPRTGIDVWQGRPGVPMPQARTSPPARRTTYDPRATSAPARPGAPFGPGGRTMGGRTRPGFRRPGGPSLPKKPVHVSTQEMSSHKKVIRIEEQVSLQQLAAKMSLKATDVLMRLLSMGMSGVNINSTLDAETAKILASEFGWSVEDVAVSEEESLEAAMGIEGVEEEDGEPRPPIVTVMGHVDHGKTSLLDKIRRAQVAAGEAGGITQHIGAYRVETPQGTIAFLDTPGHEAFTAMRARGASVTDIVILVVAADDGVMPQTKEAIAHAQSAKVPIIVAINKVDKPGSDIEKIKRDLSTHGLQPEDWGGDTMCVPVSAMTGQGIEQLLEGVLLQAEVLELNSHPDRKASGVVIEALLDRGRGPVARVMVQDGTLHTGDVLLAGPAWGKVRAMTDEKGRAVLAAGPSTPVEVLGLNEVPSAGDPVHAVKDAKTAEDIATTRRKKASKSLIPQDSRVSLEALTNRLAEADQLELKLIIKGDVQGSVEAVVHALTKLSTPKVKVTVVHAAVGGITEGDVNLAVASRAVIAGFNVRPAGKASSLAESEGVEIRLYSIIYEAVDDIRSAMEGLLPATKVEKLLGRAEVRQVFRIVKVGVVSGCMVTSGTMKRGCEARLIRDSVVVHTGRLGGLRRFKDDVKEVPEGMECGIALENYQDVKEGDIIEAFEIEEVKTKL
jgi:translation initiation factor IF-2